MQYDRILTIKINYSRIWLSIKTWLFTFAIMLFYDLLIASLLENTVYRQNFADSVFICILCLILNYLLINNKERKIKLKELNQ